MIAVTTTRSRWTVPLAAVLLVIQGLAGGAVPLAHASERFSAPAHFEARHDASCLLLHDEFRCALCHYAGSQVLSEQQRVAPAARSRTEGRRCRPGVAPASGAQHLTSPPRAPPSSRL